MRSRFRARCVRPILTPIPYVAYELTEPVGLHSGRRLSRGATSRSSGARIVAADQAAVDIEVEPKRVALKFEGTPYEDDSTDLGDDALAQLETLRLDGGPAAYGTYLIKAIVRGHVAEGFQQAISTIRGGEQSLRVRLRIGQDHRLSGIWWEGLFDDQQAIPGGWASINLGTPVSRYQKIEPQWTQSPGRSDHLKVLAVISNPRGLEQAGPWKHIPSLNDEMEAETLALALADRDRIVCETLMKPASAVAIRSALMDGPKGADSEGFHVLHLVAPAFIDPADGLAYLLLEEKDESARRLSEDELVGIVRGAPGLQLVVLPGPHSVPAAEGAALVRLAARLVEAGVPAALAMRDRLPRDPASTFLARLYILVEKSLRKGNWIDKVVNEARFQLCLAVGPERWGWLSPVLYMRGDGRLFDATEEPDVSSQHASLNKPAPTPEIRTQSASPGMPVAAPAPLPWPGQPSGGHNIYLSVAGVLRESDMSRTFNMGDKNVVVTDQGRVGHVTQADEIIYSPQEMNQLLDVLIDTLRANAALDPTLAPAAAQLEAAKAGVAASDPPEAIKSRLEKAGEILDGADEAVKKGLNLAETLGNAARMVGAAIPWVTAAIGLL